MIGLLLGRRGRDHAPGSGRAGMGRDSRGFGLMACPLSTLVCGGVAGVRAGHCRAATQPSSWLLGVAMWRPWRCCWTAAPTWRPRTRSAHRPRHRRVAPSAWFEVAMRPAAALSVVGPLLGRRGRERAPGSGVSGAGVGRERASVDCEAVADDGACWRGWHACWGAAGWRHSPHAGCLQWPCRGRGVAAGPRRRSGGQEQGQSIGRATGMWTRRRRPRWRCGQLRRGAWSACWSSGGAGSAHGEAACRGRVLGGRGLGLMARP